MADHINIRPPVSLLDMQERIANAKVRAELETLQRHYNDMASNLESIFNRIARGEPVELHYPDGTVIPITRARRRGDKDGGEA